MKVGANPPRAMAPLAARIKPNSYPETEYSRARRTNDRSSSEDGPYGRNSYSKRSPGESKKVGCDIHGRRSSRSLDARNVAIIDVKKSLGGAYNGPDTMALNAKEPSNDSTPTKSIGAKDGTLPRRSRTRVATLPGDDSLDCLAQFGSSWCGKSKGVTHG